MYYSQGSYTGCIVSPVLPPPPFSLAKVGYFLTQYFSFLLHFVIINKLTIIIASEHYSRRDLGCGQGQISIWWSEKSLQSEHKYAIT